MNKENFLGCIEVLKRADIDNPNDQKAISISESYLLRTYDAYKEHCNKSGKTPLNESQYIAHLLDEGFVKRLFTGAAKAAAVVGGTALVGKGLQAGNQVRNAVNSNAMANNRQTGVKNAISNTRQFVNQSGGIKNAVNNVRQTSTDKGIAQRQYQNANRTTTLTKNNGQVTSNTKINNIASQQQVANPNVQQPKPVNNINTGNVQQDKAIQQKQQQRANNQQVNQNANQQLLMDKRKQVLQNMSPEERKVYQGLSNDEKKQVTAGNTGILKTAVSHQQAANAQQQQKLKQQQLANQNNSRAYKTGQTVNKIKTNLTNAMSNTANKVTTGVKNFMNTPGTFSKFKAGFKARPVQNTNSNSIRNESYFELENLTTKSMYEIMEEFLQNDIFDMDLVEEILFSNIDDNLFKSTINECIGSTYSANNLSKPLSPSLKSPIKVIEL